MVVDQWKINVLLYLINEQDNGNLKMFLYAKCLNEAKYEFLIKRREDAGIKDLNDPNLLSV